MIPKTYEDAKAKGYSVAFFSYQMGYISRKTNIDKSPVMVAGGTAGVCCMCLSHAGIALSTARGCISQSDIFPGTTTREISCTRV